MAIIKHGNNALSNVTAFPSAVPTGKPVLISSATASSSASIEFTSGIDSSYNVYYFEMNSIHPSSDGAEFQFNMSTDSGSNYNVTKTSTAFNSYHIETGTDSGLGYNGTIDLAQSTSDDILSEDCGADNDQANSGFLYLYQPSSSVYVKHYMAEIDNAHFGNYNLRYFMAGYGNTTSPVNGIVFRFNSGNIDAGTIKLYGIST